MQIFFMVWQLRGRMDDFAIMIVSTFKSNVRTNVMTHMRSKACQETGT
jgi:hypothetical protein